PGQRSAGRAVARFGRAGPRRRPPGGRAHPYRRRPVRLRRERPGETTGRVRRWQPCPTRPVRGTSSGARTNGPAASPGVTVGGLRAAQGDVATARAGVTPPGGWPGAAAVSRPADLVDNVDVPPPAGLRAAAPLAAVILLLLGVARFNSRL